MIITKFAKMTEEAVIPKYAKPGDAGMDIYALTGQVIPGNARGFLVKTGLKVWLPEGYELQVSKPQVIIKEIDSINTPIT